MNPSTLHFEALCCSSSESRICVTIPSSVRLIKENRCHIQRPRITPQICSVESANHPAQGSLASDLLHDFIICEVDEGESVFHSATIPHSDKFPCESIDGAEYP